MWNFIKGLLWLWLYMAICGLLWLGFNYFGTHDSYDHWLALMALVVALDTWRKSK